MAPHTTRRRVLRLALAGAAGLGLFAAAGFAALRRPAPALLAKSCAVGAAMPGKILVTYATRTGSTAEVAVAIAERQCSGGLAADARSVAVVTSLDGYCAVILGSAIHFATWLPEIVDFARAHTAELGARPVALFTMHMLALEDTPAAAAQRATYTAKVRKVLTPASEAFFAGQIDPARLSLVDRLLVQMVGAPKGDLRDWPKIATWAESLPQLLAPTRG